MDLLEYQAKILFAEHGIPTLPSQRISSLSDIRNLKIPFPVMLKSQVHSRSRGRAGGIRMAANTIDAVAAAQSIFRLPINGQCPDTLLVEAHYRAERELYLAVVLEHNARRPLLLGAAAGGMDADLSPDRVVHVLVEEDFSPFYVRRLALGMGLSGALMRSVASVAEKMYRLFVQRDLDLVEINPLGVGADGTLMALDAKVRVNDGALARHPMLSNILQGVKDLGDRPAPSLSRASSPKMSTESHFDELNDRPGYWTPMDGSVAVVCNGMGLILATVDWVAHAGGKAAGFADVGWPTEGEGENCLGDRVLLALERAIATSNCQTVLINLIGPAINGVQIIRRLIDEFQTQGLWQNLVTQFQESASTKITALSTSQSLSTAAHGYGSQTDGPAELEVDAEAPISRGVLQVQERVETSLLGEDAQGLDAQKFDEPSLTLDLRNLKCRSQRPKLVIHCANLDWEACQALVEPYPIWLCSTIETAVKLAVDMDAANMGAATAQ
ncbi:MAG: ATP-grasp domain-containing protein [Cyanobacteria bacterium P01_D01_bin.73]